MNHILLSSHLGARLVISKSFHHPVACCYIKSIVFCNWPVGDIKKHRADWAPTEKLSEHVGLHHVGLYSASEVHKVTKNHKVQLQ